MIVRVCPVPQALPVMMKLVRSPVAVHLIQQDDCVT